MSTHVERCYFEISEGYDFLFYTVAAFKKIEYVTLVISLEILEKGDGDDVVYTLTHLLRKEDKISLIHHLKSIKAPHESDKESGEVIDIKLDYYHLKEGDSLYFRVHSNKIKVAVRAAIIEHHL